MDTRLAHAIYQIKRKRLIKAEGLKGPSCDLLLVFPCPSVDSVSVPALDY
jgi:hypothetical protein